jgi:hypothetical protein
MQTTPQGSYGPAPAGDGWYPGDSQATTRTFAEPGALEAWLDEFERSGPPPDWHARPGEAGWGPAAVVILLLVISALPVAAGWVAGHRPRIIDAEVAAFAADDPARTAPDGQAPAPFDELLTLLAGGAEGPEVTSPDAVGQPAAPSVGPGDQGEADGAPTAGGGAQSAGDELATVAGALVRIERGGGTAADANAVCGIVSCDALGGPPDQTSVRGLFSAIDSGLVGPAEAAAATGLPEAEAGRLLAAIEAARGA